VKHVSHSAGNDAISQTQLIAVCKVLGANRTSWELSHDAGHNYK
jgi:hypothetical protein